MKLLEAYATSNAGTLPSAATPDEGEAKAGAGSTKPTEDDNAGSTREQLAAASVAAREAAFRQLPPAVQKAYLACQYAETTKGQRLEDREAYDWLNENGIDQRKAGREESTKYELPSFDTWGRQVRKARKALGEQKHTQRAGRAAGSSIVRADEIEYLKGDEQ